MSRPTRFVAHQHLALEGHDAAAGDSGFHRVELSVYGDDDVVDVGASEVLALSAVDDGTSHDGHLAPRLFHQRVGLNDAHGHVELKGDTVALFPGLAHHKVAFVVGQGLRSLHTVAGGGEAQVAAAAQRTAYLDGEGFLAFQTVDAQHCLACPGIVGNLTDGEVAHTIHLRA